MASDVCDEMHLLIQADIDGELEPAQAARVAAHLSHCAACAATQARLLTLSDRLKAAMTRHAAPESLRAAVRVELAARSPAPARERLWAWGVPGLSFATGALLAACLALFIVAPRDSGLSEDVVAAHIRALQPGHLIDVASTDQHTVKPWFDGRLPFAPPVKDLAASGYPLAGGRLDYLHDHTVATLVYRGGKHIIDLFTWPSAGDRPPRSGVDQGYNFVSWHQGGMAFYAVSDMSPSELSDFVRDWQRD